MRENKFINKELDIKGFQLQSINLHDHIFKNKKGYGIAHYQWFDKGSLNVLIRTGLKKDRIISDQFSENYKRLLLSTIKDKRVPFYLDKQESEHNSTGIQAFGLMYSLRNKELSKIGNEGILFGLWPKNIKEYTPLSKTVIECRFLYSEKKGSFFLGQNNIEFFLPRSESLMYYSRYMDKKRYYILVKSLKSLMNISIKNLKIISLKESVLYSQYDLKRLINRLSVLEWLLLVKINSLLGLLDNDSWGWRQNFIYIHGYVIKIIENIYCLKKILLQVYNLNLTFKEKKLLSYKLESKEFEIIEESNLINFSKKFAELSDFTSIDMIDKKYLIMFLNEVLKSSLEDYIYKYENELGESKPIDKVKLHRVSSLKHFFKKSVVSVKSLRKVHKKISNLTNVKGIRGLLFEKGLKNNKNFYYFNDLRPKKEESRKKGLYKERVFNQKGLIKKSLNYTNLKEVN